MSSNSDQSGVNDPNARVTRSTISASERAAVAERVRRILQSDSSTVNRFNATSSRSNSSIGAESSSSNHDTRDGLQAEEEKRPDPPPPPPSLPNDPSATDPSRQSDINTRLVQAIEGMNSWMMNNAQQLASATTALREISPRLEVLITTTASSVSASSG